MKKLLFALTMIFTLSGLVSIAYAIPSNGDILVVVRNYGANNNGALESIDPTTGFRTIISDFSNPSQGPLSNGKNPAYGPPSDSGSLSGHPVLTSTGNLLVVDGSTPHTTLTNGKLFSVDPATGFRTVISDFNNPTQGPLIHNPTDMTLDNTGKILLLENIAFTPGRLYYVDPNTGVRTLLSDFANPSQGTIGYGPDSIVVSPTGAIYVSDGTAAKIFNVNPITGFRTVVSDFANPSQGVSPVGIQSITLDSSGNLIAGDMDGGTSGGGGVYAVNVITGYRTLVSDLGNPSQGPVGRTVYGLTTDASGNVIVSDSEFTLPTTGAIFKVSPTTGFRTIISDFSNLSQGSTGRNPLNISVYLPSPTDSSPPVITPTITGTLGNNGWYTSDVTVSWSVTDPESAISSSTGCTTSIINSDTAGTTLTCTATSAGGTSLQSVTIKRDATAPTITGAPTTSPNANGWYNSDVTVSYTASDSLSGLVSPPSNTVISTEGSSQSTSQTVTDLAGNSETATVTGIKLDKTAPTIIAPSSITAISTASISPSLGSPTVNDNLDLSPIVTNNAPVTFAPGTTTTVTWTATDHAGNAASASQQVIIQTPGEAIDNLILLADSYDVKTKPLDKVSKVLSDDKLNNDHKACKKLDEFIKKVGKDKDLTQTQKDELTLDANLIKSSIGC